MMTDRDKSEKLNPSILAVMFAFLDHSLGQKRTRIGLIIFCVALAIADALYKKKPYFDVEYFPGFYGIVGIGWCVLLIILAILMKERLSRPDRYYGEKSSFKVNQGGSDVIEKAEGKQNA